MAQKKVLQILYSGLGGHGGVAFALAREAARAGAWRNAFLFVGVEPVLPDYQQRVAELDADWGTVLQKPSRAALAWPSILSATLAMKPDAIILHSVKSILPVATAARMQTIPLIGVEHQANHMKHKNEWLVGEAVMRLADAVVLLTPQYAYDLRAGLGKGWRGHKAQIIPNGVDLSAFAPRSRPVSSPSRRVGFAARFADNKRQDDLIDAIGHLTARDGLDAWRLSLAGEGETRKALIERVSAAGLERVVEFPGFLGGDQLIAWFSELDLYVHATDGETLSTSMLQAMAMGLPVLGSNVPGISNLLAGDPASGLLTDGPGAAALAAGLTRLAQSPDLALELGQTARAIAEAEYGQTAMFRAYDALLTQC